MPIQMNLINKIGLMFGLLFYSFLASAITTEVIKKETAEYLLDIKYPQGFQSNGVNQAVKEFITNQQKSFMNELSEDADTPADAPGKTGLNITYSIPYQSTNALSVRFNISIYHRGAAHPSNAVKVLNFIKNQPVQLSDLFVPGSDYLQPIADLAKKKSQPRRFQMKTGLKKERNLHRKIIVFGILPKKGLLLFLIHTRWQLMFMESKQWISHYH